MLWPSSCPGHQNMTIFPPSYQGKSQDHAINIQKATLISPLPNFISFGPKTKDNIVPFSSLNSTLSSSTTQHPCLNPPPSSSSYSLPQTLDLQPLVNMNFIPSHYSQDSDQPDGLFSSIIIHSEHSLPLALIWLLSSQVNSHPQTLPELTVIIFSLTFDSVKILTIRQGLVHIFLPKSSLLSFISLLILLSFYGSSTSVCTPVFCLFSFNWIVNTRRVGTTPELKCAAFHSIDFQYLRANCVNTPFSNFPP